MVTLLKLRSYHKKCAYALQRFYLFGGAIKFIVCKKKKQYFIKNSNTLDFKEILNWTRKRRQNLVPTHKLWTTYQLAAQPFLFSWRFRFGHRHHCCLLYVVLFYEAFLFVVFFLFPEVELVYKVVFFLVFFFSKSEKVVFIDWSRGVWWWWVLLFTF